MKRREILSTGLAAMYYASIKSSNNPESSDLYYSNRLQELGVPARVVSVIEAAAASGAPFPLHRIHAIVYSIRLIMRHQNDLIPWNEMTDHEKQIITIIQEELKR